MRAAHITCRARSPTWTAWSARGRRFEPEVVFFKVSRNPFTGELSMGLSVEVLHTAMDQARVVIAELDPSMPFTPGTEHRRCLLK